MALFIIKQRLIPPAMGQAPLSFMPAMLTSALAAGSQLSQYRVVGVTDATWALQLKHVGGEASSPEGHHYLSPRVISSYLQAPGAFLHRNPWAGRRSWAALLFVLQLPLGP